MNIFVSHIILTIQFTGLIIKNLKFYEMKIFKKIKHFQNVQSSILILRVVNFFWKLLSGMYKIIIDT